MIHILNQLSIFTFAFHAYVSTNVIFGNTAVLAAREDHTRQQRTTPVDRENSAPLFEALVEPSSETELLPAVNPTPGNVPSSGSYRIASSSVGGRTGVSSTSAGGAVPLSTRVSPSGPSFLAPERPLVVAVSPGVAGRGHVQGRPISIGGPQSSTHPYTMVPSSSSSVEAGQNKSPQTTSYYPSSRQVLSNTSGLQQNFSARQASPVVRPMASSMMSPSSQIVLGSRQVINVPTSAPLLQQAPEQQRQLAAGASGTMTDGGQQRVIPRAVLHANSEIGAVTNDSSLGQQLVSVVPQKHRRHRRYSRSDTEDMEDYDAGYPASSEEDIELPCHDTNAASSSCGKLCKCVKCLARTCCCECCSKCCKTKVCRGIKGVLCLAAMAPTAFIAYHLHQMEAHPMDYVNVPYERRHEIADKIPNVFPLGWMENHAVSQLPPFRPAPVESVCKGTEAYMFRDFLTSIPKSVTQNLGQIVVQMEQTKPSQDPGSMVEFDWKTLVTPRIRAYGTHVHSWRIYTGALVHGTMIKLRSKLQNGEIEVSTGGSLLTKSAAAQEQSSFCRNDAVWKCKDFLEDVAKELLPYCRPLPTEGAELAQFQEETHFIQNSPKTKEAVIAGSKDGFSLDSGSPTDVDYIIDIAQSVAHGVVRSNLALIYEKTLLDVEFKRGLKAWKEPQEGELALDLLGPYPSMAPAWYDEVKETYNKNKAIADGTIETRDTAFSVAVDEWKKAKDSLKTLLPNSGTVSHYMPEMSDAMVEELKNNHYTHQDWVEGTYYQLAKRDWADRANKQKDYETLLNALKNHACLDHVEESFTLNFLEENHVNIVALIKRGVDLTVYMAELVQAKDIQCSRAKALKAAEWSLKYHSAGQSPAAQEQVQGWTDREDAGEEGVMPVPIQFN